MQSNYEISNNQLLAEAKVSQPFDTQQTLDTLSTTPHHHKRYRRACALVNRQRAARDGARVNPKRAYRVMAEAGLLLPKAPRRAQSSRVHDGRVAVERSDLRWCSDGLEIKCDSGQTVTATFAKDCCDREVMAWRAWEGTRCFRALQRGASALVVENAITP